VAAPPLDSPCDGPVTYPGDIKTLRIPSKGRSGPTLREEQRLEAAKMKFFRRVLGVTKLDKEKNQCIREKTGAENIVKEIKQCQEKWLQHIQRMDTNRILKQALQYKPKGRRHIG